MRENICIDNGWQFREGDIEIPQSRFKHYMYDHAKTERAITGPAAVREYVTNIAIMEDWETVDLPHDYVIRHTPEEKYNNTLGYLPYNNAWYKKKFSLSGEDREKRITLYFEGIATHATVYVNGCLMGHNYCGYTPFEIDITDVARPGEDNLVAVRVQAEEHEGWWYEGAGIYRHVWLTKTPLLCIERHGVFISPKRRGNTWDTEIKTEIRNEFFRDMGYELKITLSDAQGNEVAGCVLSGKAERKSVVTAYTCLKVKSPKLWDTENPNMYTARVTLNGEDEITVRFGFREAVFDPDKGFFLNGKPVKIKGVCCHGDFGLTGKAVPDNIFRYRIGLLREMGANGYRCAHYPHAEATMDALDENGFLVMAETRWFESTKEGLEQLSALIRRDRNHPSVIMWSLGNEEPYFGREQGKKIFARMYAEAKRLDPTRPVMCAVAGRTEQATVFDVSDIVGINYNLPSFDVLRQRYPDKCFL
ncbi:MAG: beta-galactosidase, partial [Clostridiales bacterium]|nr:beta-galactosidase [Clostridiales bacterium]